MKSKYRVAIIGHTGRGNYGHGLDTCFQRNPNCEVVGLADADEKGRAAAANKLGISQTFADYRELLDQTKPDIVSIGPRWVDQHRDMAVAAAERGIHMYMEKPMCRSLAEADEIVAACEKHNVKLALAHQTRYSPILRAVKDVIEEGRLGDVLELRGRGKEDARGGGEDLWVLGSHVFNMMHHLAGDPLWCSAKVWQSGQPATAEDIRPGNEGIGPLVGDHLTAMYGLEGGATGYFGSKKGAGGGRFGLQIFGSKGIIEVLMGAFPPAYLLEDRTWSPGRSGAKWVPITSAGPGKPEPLKDSGLDGGNDLAVTDLLDAIEQDRQPECNMYEGRTTIEMIAGLFAAHFAGRPVEIPLKSRTNPLAS
jgi:predicted dehydrogenase